MKNLENGFFKIATGKKEGGAAAYVATGILIIITIVVGAVFKDEISTFVTSFITNATQQAAANFFTT